jgi:hypothetical protein
MGSCWVKRRIGVTGDESSSVLVGSVVRLDEGVVVRAEGGDAVLWGRYDESGIGVEMVCRLWGMVSFGGTGGGGGSAVRPKSTERR